MHVLAIVASFLAVVGVWFWRANAVYRASEEIVDTLGHMRGAYRRFEFRKKARDSVLTTVDDPALAVAIFLFALANEAGITPRTEAEIRKQLSTIAPPEKIDEFMAYGAWAALHTVDPRNCARHFKNLWRSSLTIVERQQLLSMARTVCSTAEPLGPTQKMTIETLQAALAT